MHVTPFVFVLHVSLALFVIVFVCACLHMNSICIILYTCKQIRLYVLPFCCCFALYGCPLFFLLARVCTCATYALSYTHVNRYVYTCCTGVVVMHFMVALCLFVGACLHMGNICIILYTLFVSSLSLLRVFAHVQHMHDFIHMYMYTSIQFALMFLCCMFVCPFSLRVFAHVQQMHYLIHMYMYTSIHVALFAFGLHALLALLFCVSLHMYNMCIRSYMYFLRLSMLPFCC